MPSPVATPSWPNGSPGIDVTTSAGRGGRVVVASDALLVQLDALGGLAESLRSCAGALTFVVELLEPPNAIAAAVPPAAIEARMMMFFIS